MIIPPDQKSTLPKPPQFSTANYEYVHSTLPQIWLSKTHQCCIFAPTDVRPPELILLHKLTISSWFPSPDSHRLREWVFSTAGNLRFLRCCGGRYRFSWRSGFFLIPSSRISSCSKSSPRFCLSPYLCSPPAWVAALWRCWFSIGLIFGRWNHLLLRFN